MKTFKNYLIENNTVTVLNESEIIPLILSECQQWFREICDYPIKTNEDLKRLLNDNYSFFRGRGENKKHLIEQSREDRKPRDTPLFFHIATIKALQKLGFYAHRGNSLFCTNNFGLANEYATYMYPHIGFVMDGYNYTFSEKIKDYVFLIHKPIRELKDLFVNYDKILDLIDNNDSYTIFNIALLKKMEDQKLADLMEINADVFQKKIKFQNSEIKKYLYNSKPIIEFMVRGKIILTQLPWLQDNL